MIRVPIRRVLTPQLVVQANSLLAAHGPTNSMPAALEKVLAEEMRGAGLDRFLDPGPSPRR